MLTNICKMRFWSWLLYAPCIKQRCVLQYLSFLYTTIKNNYACWLYLLMLISGMNGLIMLNVGRYNHNSLNFILILYIISYPFCWRAPGRNVKFILTFLLFLYNFNYEYVYVCILVCFCIHHEHSLCLCTRDLTARQKKETRRYSKPKYYKV